jgi:RepB DNA-primase from phage plasmid
MTSTKFVTSTSILIAAAQRLSKRSETQAVYQPPNYVLETSPRKFQVVWKVENVNQDEAEDLQRRMAREFHADLAPTDYTRVLRLPTFVNRKYEDEHIVTAGREATTRYRLEDFRLREDDHDERR